ncbi:MAG: 2-hydroxyhepta-2,4-diene,7-dioate isomerase [Acidimicrobiaceae bacterium]|nr:2-hydroxyhepta-2,4-diene,7-dioate isomerase [Acidimicrobiaceae bacterium]
MRLMRIGERGAERPAVVTDDGLVRALPGIDDIDGRFWGGTREDAARRFVAEREGDVLGEITDEGRVLLSFGARVGAPIARPNKTVGIGVNYRDHATEVGLAFPDEPVIFMKATNTVNGPYDDILIPRGSAKTDWETELGVVIAREARYLAAPAASTEVIAGYLLANDVSERELQFEHGPTIDKGKSCETFNPLGPWLLTRDEVPAPQSVGLRCWVNGEARQNGTTADMIFEVDHLIWYVSQLMVLEPGDLVLSGSPAGVSMGHDDVPFLKAGDRIELEGDGLGRQSNRLVEA